MLSLARHRIETDRLVLTPPATSDAQRIADLANNFEIARYLGSMPHPYALKDAHEFIERIAQDDDWHVFCIRPKPEHAMVGMCGYGPHLNDAEFIDFGYWLGLDYQRRGYAREAAAAVLIHAFCVSQVDEIETHCRLENTRSKQLLDGLGFETLGQSEHYSLAEDRKAPTYRVRLTCSNWLNSRACA